MPKKKFYHFAPLFYLCRQALNYGFDFVFYLEEDQNSAGLKLGDFAKLYSLVALRSFKNCAFVSPSMLALKNCDDIFSNRISSFLLLEDGMDTSVFLFKPSIEHFEALTLGLKHSNKNGMFYWIDLTHLWLCPWLFYETRKNTQLSVMFYKYFLWCIIYTDYF